MKAITTAVIFATLTFNPVAEGQPCQVQHATAGEQVTQASNPFTSADQARLAELLEPDEKPANVTEQIRLQVLANRQATQQQFTAMQQPPLIGSKTHYALDRVLDFTHDHYNTTYQFRVKGTTHGRLWGSGVYTSDSHLGAAAVHAGILEPNETQTVTIRIVRPPSSFHGETRHGVQSHKWGHWDGAFEFVTDSPAESMFVSSDLARLTTALNQPEPTNPVDAIRQQVLSNRAKANEQSEALLATVNTIQQERAQRVVIDSRSERMHAHGREYWIVIQLVNSGEMYAHVSVARRDCHGFEEVHDMHDVPNQVRRQLQHLHHDMIATYPDHSPELAALSWRVRNTITQQRAETDEQFASLLEWMLGQTTVTTITEISR